MRLTTTMPHAMILCGGMGIRLGDITGILPKPMMPAAPQPIFWHIHGARRRLLSRDPTPEFGRRMQSNRRTNETTHSLP